LEDNVCFLRLEMSSDPPSASSSVFPPCINSYPSGQIGFILATKGRASCKKPVRKPVDEAVLRYYTPELHEAAFVLPAFCKRQIEGENK
jgi:spermidine synthase